MLLRLGRSFDALFAHDAIDYMTVTSQEAGSSPGDNAAMRAPVLPWSSPSAVTLTVARASLTWAFPFVALAIYAVVVAAHAADLSSATFLYSDAPESAYLGAGIVSGHAVTLPLHSEIAPVAVEGLLFGLPGGHVLVQLLGPALAVTAVAIVGGALRRLGAMWPVAVVAGLAAGPAALWQFLWPLTHVFTLVAIALLGWVIVRLATRGLTRWSLLGVIAVSGLALLGDQGFVVTGIIPLLAAAFAIARTGRDGRPLLLIVVGAALVWIFGQVLLRVVGVSILISPTVNPGGFDPAHALTGVIPGVASAVQGLGWMVTGSWYGGNLAAPLYALQLIAGCTTVLVPPLALVVQARKLNAVQHNHAQIAYCTFWTAVDALVVIAYGGFGLATSPTSAHYLIPCLVAASACLPLLGAGRRAAHALRAAAAGLVVLATLGLSTVHAEVFSGAHPPLQAQRIVATLEAAGLDRGFADYWMAHPLTWFSDERIHVYPVDEHCSSDATALCRYAISDARWYEARGGSTFLIVRSSYRCLDTAPQALLGPPQRVIKLDATSTILVYDYDIATRLSIDNNQACIP